eukprot:scaffold1771_cov343-Pavlova_lutheri.AAC.20
MYKGQVLALHPLHVVQAPSTGLSVRNAWRMRFPSLLPLVWRCDSTTTHEVSFWPYLQLATLVVPKGPRYVRPKTRVLSHLPCDILPKDFLFVRPSIHIAIGCFSCVAFLDHLLHSFHLLRDTKVSAANFPSGIVRTCSTPFNCCAPGAVSDRITRNVDISPAMLCTGRCIPVHVRNCQCPPFGRVSKTENSRKHEEGIEVGTLQEWEQTHKVRGEVSGSRIKNRWLRLGR